MLKRMAGVFLVLLSYSCTVSQACTLIGIMHHTHMNASLTVRQCAYYCTENSVGKLAKQIKIYTTAVADGDMRYFTSSGEQKLQQRRSDSAGRLMTDG